MRQLESAHATRPEAVEWLLDVCDSTPIYRARYLGAPRLSQMLNLLLYDDGHPMALAFHRRSIDRDLDDLARSLGGERERGVPDVPLLPQGSAELLDAAARRAMRRAPISPPSSPRSPRAPAELSDRLVAPLLRADRIRRARARHMTAYHEQKISRPPRDHATSTPPTWCTRITCCTWCRVRRRTRNAWSTRSTITPGNHRRVDELDAFGNPLIRIELAQPHRELTVVSQMQIEVHARPAVSPETTEPLGEGARLVRVSRRLAVARPARRRALPPRVAARAPEAVLHRLLRGVFSGRAGPSWPARKR